MEARGAGKRGTRNTRKGLGARIRSNLLTNNDHGTIELWGLNRTSIEEPEGWYWYVASIIQSLLSASGGQECNEDVSSSECKPSCQGVHYCRRHTIAIRRTSYHAREEGIPRGHPSAYRTRAHSHHAMIMRLQCCEGQSWAAGVNDHMLQRGYILGGWTLAFNLPWSPYWTWTQYVKDLPPTEAA